MELLSQLTGVALALAALAGAVYLGRRNGWIQVARPSHSRGASRVEILERHMLTPQHSLHLVRVENQTILLALSAGGCTVVERLPQESAK